jgi:hypothetical protein
MATKKSKNQTNKQIENREAARRTRTLQIVVAAFSIILILSMILSLASK